MADTNGSTIDTSSGNVADGGRVIVSILCGLMIAAVLLFGAVDSGTLVILAVLLTILLAVWFWKAVRQGSFAVSLDSIQLPLIALAIVGGVQLLPLGNAGIPGGSLSVGAASSLSLDPYATRFFLARLFLCVIFFAAALTFINKLPRLRAVVVVLIAFAGLLAFYSILQRVEDPGSIYGLRQSGQAIPFGTYINRHHFAALMEMTLGLTLGILFAGGLNKNRWPFIIAAAVAMAISIVLTGSRGGMIGLFSSIIAIAVVSIFAGKGESERRGFSPVMILIAGVAFFVLTAGMVLFLGGADPLLRSTGIDAGAGDFSSGRIEFWKTAIKIFFDRPMIGAGLDAFGAAYSSYDSSSGLFRVEQAHNDYLQMLADGGIIGFACVAAFIYLLLRKSLRTLRLTEAGFRRGAAIGALAGCFAVIVHSFFDFPLRTPANAFVFLTLAAIAIVPITAEKPLRHRRARKSSEV